MEDKYALIFFFVTWKTHWFTNWFSNYCRMEMLSEGVSAKLIASHAACRNSNRYSRSMHIFSLVRVEEWMGWPFLQICAGRFKSKFKVREGKPKGPEPVWNQSGLPLLVGNGNSTGFKVPLALETHTVVGPSIKIQKSNVRERNPKGPEPCETKAVYYQYPKWRYN